MLRHDNRPTWLLLHFSQLRSSVWWVIARCLTDNIGNKVNGLKITDEISSPNDVLLITLILIEEHCFLFSAWLTYSKCILYMFLGLLRALQKRFKSNKYYQSFSYSTEKSQNRDTISDDSITGNTISDDSDTITIPIPPKQKYKTKLKEIQFDYGSNLTKCPSKYENPAEDDWDKCMSLYCLLNTIQILGYTDKSVFYTDTEPTNISSCAERQKQFPILHQDRSQYQLSRIVRKIIFFKFLFYLKISRFIIMNAQAWKQNVFLVGPMTIQKDNTKNLLEARNNSKLLVLNWYSWTNIVVTICAKAFSVNACFNAWRWLSKFDLYLFCL